MLIAAEILSAYQQAGPEWPGWYMEPGRPPAHGMCKNTTTDLPYFFFMFEKKTVFSSPSHDTLSPVQTDLSV